jgi:hypothetical protein
MAYIINKYNGEQLIVLEDGTIDTSTSLGLVGRNYVGYGETQNENFVFLLENFANDAAPSRPVQGQLWFDTSINLLKAYDGGNWSLVGAAVSSSTAPVEPSVGALWLKTPINTLNVWTGTEWRFVGPEAVEGFGITRARSGSLEDSTGNARPVIFLDIDNQPTAICTNSAFTINPANSIAGFNNNLVAGINLRTTSTIQGNITGSAGSANRLTTSRFINNALFDGQADITVKASTTNKLKKGSYLTGSDFDGSTEQTWSVDASSANIIGKVVARNSEGGFAAGTITANLIGNVIGNVTSDTGTSSFNIVQANTFVGATLTGTANAARQLVNNPKINGVTFTGLGDVIVPAAADTLTASTLATNVVNSSLTSVGTLINLSVNDTGITVGSGSQLRLLVDNSVPTVRSSAGSLNFDIGPSGPDISFVNGATALSLGGPNAPAIIGDNTTNLGITGYKFNSVYANNFFGNADTATLATRATNIIGGGLGAIPYQTAANTTTMLGLGADGFVLRSRSNGPAWEALGSENLTKGSYVNFVNTITSNVISAYNLNVPVTISVDAATTNTANKIVARDASGNFSAGTVTGNLTGNVTGNLTGNVTGNTTGIHTGNVSNATLLGMATNGKIQWPNDPYGGGGDTAWIDVYSRGGERQALRLYVNNDGPGSVEDIIELDAAAGVLVTRGNVTCAAAPTSGSHLVNKSYVDAVTQTSKVLQYRQQAWGTTYQLFGSHYQEILSTTPQPVVFGPNGFMEISITPTNLNSRITVEVEIAFMNQYVAHFQIRRSLNGGPFQPTIFNVSPIDYFAAKTYGGASPGFGVANCNYTHYGRIQNAVGALERETISYLEFTSGNPGTKTFRLYACGQWNGTATWLSINDRKFYRDMPTYSLMRIIEWLP